MFSIDPESATPPFEQLRSQLRDRIADGSLAGGAKLPTVRALADELELAPNTVARAYRELEADGILETRGRNGTFVSTHGSPVEQRAQLAAQEYARSIRSLGIDLDTALALAKAALRENG